MRRSSFLILLLLHSIYCSAQEESHAVYHTPRNNYLIPQEAPTEYVLGNEVALRTGPSITSGLVAVLSVGTPVTIEERNSEELVQRGLKSAWYRVTSQEGTGHIWGGNIAQHGFGSTADATVKFLGGIDHITPSDTGITDFGYRLVALRNGKEVDRIVVRSFAHGFEEVRNVGTLGVPGVDDIIVLRVPCVGGCGCTTGEVLVFWSGGKFHHVADLMGSPDGPYSTNVSFVYPSDLEGLPGTIIRVTSDYLDAPEEEGNASYITRTLKSEYLRWDGKALVPSGRATEEKQYHLEVD